jgi:hypothetical protein
VDAPLAIAKPSTNGRVGGWEEHRHAIDLCIRFRLSDTSRPQRGMVRNQIRAPAGSMADLFGLVTEQIYNEGAP